MRTVSIFALAAALANALSCTAPEYGELPATCRTDSSCPEGYACTQGICARPGTAVPMTIAASGNLRGVDLQLVSEDDSALVVWQTYAYSETGERITAKRVFPNGTTSGAFDLVSNFEANDNSVEPYFDVLRTAPNKLLVALSAPPLVNDESSEPRLITYRATLTSAGPDVRAQTRMAWAEEERLPTIGYGAVSRPALVSRGPGNVELGYFRSRSIAAGEDGTPAQTLGELAVFRLDDDGAVKAGCEEECCPAHACYRARDGLTVAVGVIDAFPQGANMWWLLDDVRPSALFVPDEDPSLAVGVALPPLAIPVSARDKSLVYIRPSTRSGDKLATSDVTGLARLYQSTVGGASAEPVAIGGEFAGVRDNPRPTWIERPGKPALLITPGTDLRANGIQIRTVDPLTGVNTIVTTIARYATAPLGALRAVTVRGRLYVAWVDAVDTLATIRLAVVAEP